MKFRGEISMSKNILDILKGNLIVSCQALEHEPLYNSDFSLMPFMAKAALQAGAKGIRANSARDVIAIKEVFPDVPLIGLVKRDYEGGEQYITVTMREVDELVEAGADIVALDATLRPRFDGITINEFISQIKTKYPSLLLMADISTFEEGVNAEKAGVDLVGTTMNGYTPYTESTDKSPNFDLVHRLSEALTIPVVAEGRIHEPLQAKQMFKEGAFTVVVGGAITRPLEIATRFVKAIQE